MSINNFVVVLSTVILLTGCSGNNGNESTGKVTLYKKGLGDTKIYVADFDSGLGTDLASIHDHNLELCNRGKDVFENSIYKSTYWCE